MGLTSGWVKKGNINYLMRRSQLSLLGAAILGGILSSGCGQKLSSGSVGGMSNLSSNSSNDVEIPLEKIDQTTVEAEDALSEAQQTLDNLIQNGQIHLPSSNGFETSNSFETSKVGTSYFQTQSLTGIAEKLQIALQLLISKIAAPVQKAKDLINVARLQLTASLATLDPNNPSHAAMIRKIQEMMTKLDLLESRLGDVYKLLHSKIDFVVSKIDALILKLSASGNPLVIILIYELQEVRRVLTTLVF